MPLLVLEHHIGCPVGFEDVGHAHDARMFAASKRTRFLQKPTERPRKRTSVSGLYPRARLLTYRELLWEVLLDCIELPEHFVFGDVRDPESTGSDH